MESAKCNTPAAVAAFLTVVGAVRHPTCWLSSPSSVSSAQPTGNNCRKQVFTELLAVPGVVVGAEAVVVKGTKYSGSGSFPASRETDCKSRKQEKGPSHGASAGKGDADAGGPPEMDRSRIKTASFHRAPEAWTQF